MDNSISSLIVQVNKLLDNVETFRGRLEHHAIKEPQAQLYDALRNGFPEDIYTFYLNNYLKVNGNAVDEILKDIDNGFIPYLKDVAFHLQEAVNVGSDTKSSGMSKPSPKTKSVDDIIHKAIEKNNNDMATALKTSWLKEGMTIAEADKQNANPNYTPMWIENPGGNYYKYNGKMYKRVWLTLLFPETHEMCLPCYSKNPNYRHEFSINCATTSAAYALRVRGLILWAKGNPEKEGDLNTWLSDHHCFDIWSNIDGTKAQPTLYGDWMKKKGLDTMSPKDYIDFFEEECKEKGVYVVTTYWKKGGGHATILQRDVDGKLYFIEPQVFEADMTDEEGRRKIDDLVNRMSSHQQWNGVMRVDDKIFNVKYADLFEK